MFNTTRICDMPNRKCYGLYDSLRWGKHAGVLIKDLVYSDPGYILWMSEQKKVVFSYEVLKKAQVYNR